MSRPTKAAARAELAAAKAELRKAVRGDAAVNMARPGAAMEYPESEAYVAAAARVRAAKRALWWAR